MGRLGDLWRSIFAPAKEPPASTDPRAVGRELRRRFLSTTAAELGLRPSPEFPRVFGVAMDWAAGEETVTLAALCDGSASLYSTSAFGIPSGGAHEPVRAAARRFVRAADAFLDEGVPAGQFDYPPCDTVRYFLCSYGGVRVLSADLAAILDGTSPCRELFAAGQDVLSKLRRVSGERA